ncbi:MAG: glucose 1-dehydrogenase [Nitrospinota bacterium]|nr:MAG: glucose 1-dehydrogenase [Nitrospinota bacterium]
MKLADRVAIVTGAGRGIGKAIALAFAREGAHLVLAARTPSQIAAVAEEIRGMGRQVLALPTDVAEAGAVRAMVAETVQTFARIDILVNNAGVISRSLVVNHDDAEWQRILAINLTGPYLCIKAVLPTMLHQRYGRIINIASTAGKGHGRYISAYCASKHGLLGLTKCVAVEVAAENITCNAICPGWVWTPMAEEEVVELARLEETSPAEIRRRILAEIPQGRAVTPEEVAALAVYLASDEAAGMTGQAITLDGGRITH